MLQAAQGHALAFAKARGLHLAWRKLRSFVQDRQLARAKGHGPISFCLAVLGQGGREEGREGGRPVWRKTLLVVLSGMAWVGAWLLLTWRKVQTWGKKAALGLRVEKWTDLSQAACHKASSAAAQALAIIRITLCRCLASVQTTWKERLYPSIMAAWTSFLSGLSPLWAWLASRWEQAR
ncbi:hypothetical protein Naga_102099g1, partial [Nannochloropsis gaditana]